MVATGSSRVLDGKQDGGGQHKPFRDMDCSSKAIFNTKLTSDSSSTIRILLLISVAD